MRNKKRAFFSTLLMLCLLLSCCAAAAFADQTRKNSVYELYSVDGHYEDGVGNSENYSFHVPQILDDTADAEEINTEIAERFGRLVETQFANMESGVSLWSWTTEWKSHWSGDQIFLVVRSYMNGDIEDYAAYAYDFGTGSRVTNAMILEQRGISEEEYLENLKEKVTFMFDDQYTPPPAGVQSSISHDDLLNSTLSWLDLEQPMYVNEFGEIVTIVKIASIPGSGWYYTFATPFVYG